jgi:hypothetical protein
MSDESAIRREILAEMFDKNTPVPTFGSGRSMSVWVDEEVARRMPKKKAAPKKQAKAKGKAK